MNSTIPSIPFGIRELRGSHEPRRAKVLVFPLTWVLAHVGRTIEIAKELRARGHEVVFAGQDPEHPASYLRHALQAGFRVVRVKEPQWHWAWKRFHDHGGVVGVWDFFTHNRWAPLDAILEDMIRVVREEKPDLLLGDASIGVTTVGHILGVKAAGVLNSYNLRFFKPWGFYRGLIRACDRLKWAPIRRRVYRRYGVKPIDAFELLQQTPLLSPDLEAFDDPRDTFPNWQPIGPLVFEPSVALPDWYDELSDGTTNVYITMGSTGFLEPLLRRSYEALGRTPYRYVVTTGGQVSDEGMKAAPKNFRFARHAPGSRILEHSSAVVFHGGNGTMYQALAAGVPMLALPSHLEQHVSIAAGLREGFARQHSSRNITGDELVKEIEHLLKDPLYKINAWRFRNAVRNAGAASKAADILETHMTGIAQRRKAAAL